MLCIDSFKCQQFLSDTDEHFKKVEVINFNIIHHKYRGDPLQKDLKTYQSVQKKTFLGTINRKRKILFHLPYVTNVKIFQSKRQLLTNILRACNVFFFFSDLYKHVYKILCVLSNPVYWFEKKGGSYYRNLYCKV